MIAASSDGAPEQLRHPRQNSSPVMSRVLALSAGIRVGDDVAGLHLAARIDRDDGVDREQVARRRGRA